MQRPSLQRMGVAGWQLQRFAVLTHAPSKHVTPVQAVSVQFSLEIAQRPVVQRTGR